MSCRVALLKLHRQGIVKLPECTVKGLFEAKKENNEPIEQIEPVSCDLNQLGGVELIRVGSRESKASRVWNALMDRYHYLGSGPLCGAQMRYLIKSPSYGWLGGFAFSGAAWRVEAGDRWIGWRDGAREKHLSRDRFHGSCYRAANWQYVGSTCGRGREDRERMNSVPAKRLVSIVREFYARPQVSVAQACQSRAKTKAAYRFFEHPHMSMDKVVEQHYESTLGRVSQGGW